MSKLSPHAPDPPAPTGEAPGGQSSSSVPPETYSREYFLTECQGYQDFVSGRISSRLQTALDLAGHLAGTRVLDVGSGRGEVAVRCAQAGADAYGVDYSPEALALARAAAGAAGPSSGGTPAGLRRSPDAVRSERVHFQLGDGQYLPFPDAAFDRAFMLDIVEHLYPDQLLRALREVQRVLADDGVLIVHTMPNLWYYRFGYPLYRLLQRLRGHKLPRDPRQRWQFVPAVHVNEQTIWRLGHALRDADFQARVWLQPTQDYREEKNALVRLCMRMLVTWYPFRWVFCDEIFALARKGR